MGIDNRWVPVIIIVCCSFAIGLGVMQSLSPSSNVDRLYCGQEEKYYALELGYYISANTTEEGMMNRTIPVLKQYNCLTYHGLNQSTGIYAITNEDLLSIFQNISLNRCNGATQTFQHDISCRIWNGTDWNESLFAYTG